MYLNHEGDSLLISSLPVLTSPYVKPTLNLSPFSPMHSRNILNPSPALLLMDCSTAEIAYLLCLIWKKLILNACKSYERG